jgi:hypothetical protein
MKNREDGGTEMYLHQLIDHLMRELITSLVMILMNVLRRKSNWSERRCDNGFKDIILDLAASLV